MAVNTLPSHAQTSVLVIGGGPTGLTAALLLARYGLKIIVVERHHERTGQPKAHAINPRSLEIFRQIGLDTVHLRNLGVPPEDGDAVRFAISMAGKQHGTLSYERQGPETLDITPEPLFNIAQPILEDFLLQSVVGNKNITLFRGVQWEACRQIKSILSSSVKERLTGALKVIESSYILDCGGANSRAREKLEIPFSPLPEYIQNEVHHLSIHFNADFTRFDPGTLWWISSPQADGTFICYERSSNWVFVTYYNPQTTSVDKFTEHYCRDLLDKAIGEKVPYDILSITAWSTWPRTAEFYQSKLFSRAFVVGDAAHAFPPTGGLGVNTGIADAQNIAWKIHAVEQAWAEDVILETYGRERRPIAVANAIQSVKNQVKLRGLKAALQNPPESDDSPEGREWKQRLDHELQVNAEHFDSIRLQIGYIYGNGELADQPCDRYVAGREPGLRLPHSWISYKGERKSTLDLVDGRGFVAFVSSGSSNYLSVPETVARDIPLQAFQLGVDFESSDEKWIDVVGLSTSNTGLLVRPDQHIVGNFTSIDDINKLIRTSLEL